MNRAWILACVFALACGGKKKAPEPEPEPPPPPPPDAAPAPIVGPSGPLWDTAPDGAIAGLVIPEGAVDKLEQAWGAVGAAAATDPFWKQQASWLDRYVRMVLGASPDAGPRSSRAIFFDQDGALIVDAAQARGRPSKLASLATVLPTLRGDAELRIDTAGVRAFRDLRDRLDEELIAGSNAWGAALVVDGDSVTLDVHLTGRLFAPWSELLAEPTGVAGLESRRASSGLSVTARVHPDAMARWAKAGGVELEHIAPFSGDVGVFVRAGAPAAIELVLGVTDATAARRSVGPLCNALLRPFGPIEKLAEGECRVRITAPADVAGGRLGRAFLGAVADRLVVMELAGDVLVVRMGEAAPASEAASAPSSAAAPPSAPVPWQLWVRARPVDPLALVPGLAAAVDTPVADALRWLAAHGRALDVGLRVGPTGVRGHVRLTVGSRGGRSPQIRQ